MRSANSLSPIQRERLARLQPWIDAQDPIHWWRQQEYAKARREARRRELLHCMAIPFVVTLLLLAAAAFVAILISPRDPASPYGDAVGAPTRMAAPAPSPTDPKSMARAIAIDHGIPPRLFSALIQTESSWKVNARGAAGEVGLTQLLPRTARHLGVDPHDVHGNLLGGAMHLRSHYVRTGDWTLALARYNGRGPMARAYAQKVLRAWEASE